jgi:two-component system, NarL family, response regulator
LPIRVLIVEDHAVVRDGLAAILGFHKDMAVVGWAGDGQEAVEMFVRLRPDVTLMDRRMPRLGGAEAIAQIRSQHGTAAVIVLTTHGGDEDVYRALQAGARGYLLKDTTSEELLRAIRVVHGGSTHIPPEVSARLAERAIAGPSLSPREVEVLTQVAAGKTNKEIGTEFFITEGTVKSHLCSILEKLGVRDRTEAVVEAVRRGILRLGEGARGKGQGARGQEE